MTAVAAWHRLSAQDESAQPYWIPREFPALNLIQGQPLRALDIGCSAGYAAEALHRLHPHCEVWGVEPNALAAAQARTRVARVLEGDFTALDWPALMQGQRFDVVLLLDVLEHMYNPWRALQKVRELLSPTGEVIVSLPNVRNYALMQDLSEGYWHYRDSGLLDVTHIRFFTDYEATKMYFQTGFRPTTHFSFVDGNWQEWQKITDFPHWVERNKLRVRADSSAELLQLATISNVVRLVPVEPENLSPEERVLASGEHPATLAAC